MPNLRGFSPRFFDLGVAPPVGQSQAQSVGSIPQAAIYQSCPRVTWCVPTPAQKPAQSCMKYIYVYVHLLLVDTWKKQVWVIVLLHWYYEMLKVLQV